jgi:RNA polymerase sporulation-specific sigma factor
VLVLLRRARRGDRYAEQLLIELHEPLARQICQGFYLPNGDSSDLLQAARIGIWRAIRGWDPLGGSGFRSFAALVMRREVMMLVTAARRQNQRPLNSACSLYVRCACDGEASGPPLADTLVAPIRDAKDPEHESLVRERLELLLGGLSELSSRERGSLSMALNGYEHAQIGAALGGGAKGANNALQRARRKLRASS